MTTPTDSSLDRAGTVARFRLLHVGPDVSKRKKSESSPSARPAHEGPGGPRKPSRPSLPSRPIV